jgi:NIMA (never in mitosis gene a)-related kinase
MADSNANTSNNSDNELIQVKDRYKQIKVLGRGSYGEVWLVTPLESSVGSKSKPRRCVLKRVSLNRANDEKNELAAAEREAQLLSSLKHPNIVAYIESFRSRDRHLNIVMAFCEGGDLYTKLKYRKKQLLNEEQIIDWFIQITLALQYMHERSILHRDLKTQNIFLTRYEIIKIGDLGIAKILDNNGADLATTVIGTPYVFKIIIEINIDCLLLDII